MTCKPSDTCTVTFQFMVIYPDSWVKGFYFQCDRMDGGIVRHEDVVKGKDGLEYKKIYYAMHT